MQCKFMRNVYGILWPYRFINKAHRLGLFDGVMVSFLHVCIQYNNGWESLAPGI